MFVNCYKSIPLLRFLRTFYSSISWGCPGIIKKQQRHGCGLQQMGIYHTFVQGLHHYWFHRHLNPKFLKRDFQLPTIMGMQLNISLSSCLVIVVCITSSWFIFSYKKVLFALHYNYIDQHVVILLVNMLLNFHKPLKSCILHITYILTTKQDKCKQ